MLLFLVCAITRLKNNIIISDREDYKISKHEYAWYYLKFENSSHFRQIIPKAGGIIDNCMALSDGFYTAYLRNSVAKNLHSVFGVWTKKIPARHKSSNESISSHFFVFAASECKLPGDVLSSNSGVSLVSFASGMDGAKLLAKTKCVRTFEPVRSKLEYHYRFDKDLLLEGTANSWDPENRTWFDAFRGPLEDLEGLGECAVIADTGIDPDHVMFYDPGVKISYNNVMNHRKIKLVIPYGDTVDRSGHGTFVAGILAGESNCQDDVEYSGVAPRSKLVIADLEGDDFLVPGNWSNLMHIAKVMNCTVQLNTWTMKDQPLLTFLADFAAYNNPEQLMIFAGDSDEHGVVSTPADAKNVLTVGALYSHPSAISSIEHGSVFVYPTGLGRPIAGYCDEMGVSLLHSHDNLEQLAINRTSACILDDALDDPVSYENCSVLLVFHDRPLAHRINKPVIRMPNRWSDRFVSDLEISVVPIDNDGDYSESPVNLRPESPKRSVYPLRIKPEVVAPGGPVVGPKANSTSCGNDAMTVKYGASISAAAAAGEVLLLSEFLRRKRIVPTANVVRSLLALAAVNPRDESVTHSPGYGFGIPILKSITESMPKLVTGTLGSGTTIQYNYVPAESGPLTLTVAFLDHPKDPMAQRQISSMIRVYIKERHVTDDRFIMGNEIAGSAPVHDVYNTILKIQTHVNIRKLYTIVFTASDFDFLPEIEFTMAFTNGTVDGPHSEWRSAECPRPCNNGRCVHGRCECIGSFVGDFCEHEITLISFADRYPVDPMPRGHWKYFIVAVNKWEPGSKILFDCEDLDMDKLELVFSFSQIPTLNDCDCSFRRCQMARKVRRTLEIEYKDWSGVKSSEHLIIGLFAESPVTTSGSLNVTLSI